MKICHKKLIKKLVLNLHLYIQLQSSVNKHQEKGTSSRETLKLIIYHQFPANIK